MPAAAGSGSETCELTCRNPFATAASSTALERWWRQAGRHDRASLTAPACPARVRELEAEHRAEAPEAGLRLVRHEQHAALAAERARAASNGRRNDDAARPEHRLDDEQARTPTRLTRLLSGSKRSHRRPPGISGDARSHALRSVSRTLARTPPACARPFAAARTPGVQ